LSQSQAKLSGTLIFSHPTTGKSMNLDKAKKRIVKQVKKGFDGYPLISLAYFGATADCATEVDVTFLAEAGAEAQVQKFTGTSDVREVAGVAVRT
jgi:hypothetical protein